MSPAVRAQLDQLRAALVEIGSPLAELPDEELLAAVTAGAHAIAEALRRLAADRVVRAALRLYRAGWTDPASN